MCIKGAKKIYFGVFKTEKSKTGICVGCGSGKDTHCGLGNIQRSLAWFLQKGREREKERPQRRKKGREKERETEIYYKQVAHTIMKSEKSQDLQLTSCMDTQKSCGISSILSPSTKAGADQCPKYLGSLWTN